MTEPVVAARAAYAQKTVAPGTKSTIELVVEVRAIGSAVDGTRPKLSVCFAIDASSSMNGAPIEHVLASVGLLTDLLQPTDKACIVAFADAASEVAPLAALDIEGKRVLKRRVQSVRASGNTNIEAAMTLALRSLGAEQVDERRVLLLLSDGQPNRGETSAERLAGLAAAQRAGMSTSCLGYGLHHDADLLKSVADAGGGQYWFVADPKEATSEFARALGAQGDVVADGIELVLQPAEGVEIGEVRGGAGQPKVSARGLVVPLPDLREHAVRVIVVKLAVAAPAERGALVPIEIEVRHRRAGKSEVLSTPARAGLGAAAAPHDVEPWAYAQVVLADAENARKHARDLADRDQFAAAAALLRATMKRIVQTPLYVAGDGQPLDEAYEQLVDEVTAYERAPTKEEYLSFRQASLGVDVGQGGKHVADNAMTGASAKALGNALAGVVPEAYAIVKNAGTLVQTVRLGADSIIGRAPGNEIVLPVGNVSKRHTRILCRDGKFSCVDLGSTNGTLMNGERVRAPRMMNDGDTIQLGAIEITLQMKPPP